MNGPLNDERGGFLAHAAIAVAGLVALSSCGSIRDQFLGVRVKDECDGTWPVCSTTVGCMVGDRSYVEGRFPGTARVAYRLFEPSTVTVALYLTETAGSGEETTIHFYEDQCRSSIRTAISGRSLFGEAEKAGFVWRENDLSGIGDHLLDVVSDARTHYLLKVDVVPLRLKDAPTEP